jgi:hypothetical protein
VDLARGRGEGIFARWYANRLKYYNVLVRRHVQMLRN